jgi:hypothetical protein
VFNVFKTGALRQLKLRLRKYNIFNVAVQETKWKGVEKWLWGILLYFTAEGCKIRLKHDDHNEYKQEVGSALFWDFTQPRLVVCYRAFGTTYLSHLQGCSGTA